MLGAILVGLLVQAIVLPPILRGIVVPVRRSREPEAADLYSPAIRARMTWVVDAAAVAASATMATASVIADRTTTNGWAALAWSVVAGTPIVWLGRKRTRWKLDGYPGIKPWKSLYTSTHVSWVVEVFTPGVCIEILTVLLLLTNWADLVS